MQFTEKVINFLLLMEKKGYLTRDEQNFLNNLQFYFMTGYLKKNGLIKVNGVDQNRQQIWTLSEKGKKVCRHLSEIKKIMEAKNEV